MNPNARIWIYQCNRFLTESEELAIAARLTEFATNWTAHQQALRAEAFVQYGLFLIFAVDENLNDASGCSIDKSVHLLQGLEKEFNIQVFDRFNLSYRDEQGQLQVCNRTGFEQLIQEGRICSSTPVFNNLIQTYGELERGWEIPLKNSWHARVFSLQQA